MVPSTGPQGMAGAAGTMWGAGRGERSDGKCRPLGQYGELALILWPEMLVSCWMDSVLTRRAKDRTGNIAGGFGRSAFCLARQLQSPQSPWKGGHGCPDPVQAGPGRGVLRIL
jgi:hypothetical protein